MSPRLPLLLVLSTLALIVYCLQPEVRTKHGRVFGFRHTASNGGEANVYLGVPFAKPPLGELRFEKPQPPEPWTSPLNATSWAPSCQPYPGSGIPRLGEFSEDCLVLNVITPTEKSSDPRGYPVLLWIHGGGFVFGGPRLEGYETFVKNYIPQGVIIVTIQYRLGVLGFISIEDVIPGNLGLWDQAAALKFVHENIGAFGGDSEQITIWGESAGGASVSYLTVSPVTRGWLMISIKNNFFPISLPVQSK